jgi:hypothetical protein
MLSIVKKQLKNKSFIEITYLIEENSLGKIIEHNDRF